MLFRSYPRRHLNATVLPTGEVLVTSGTRATSFDDPSLAVHVAEIWNPETGVWRKVASNSVNRSYHSTSLLLPDGRVLHAGSGGATFEDGSPMPDQKNAELFSPPYLFAGARPTISSAPGSVVYGSTFTVGPGWDLVIDKFVYNPSKGTGEIAASFSRVMRFVGGKISKNEESKHQAAPWPYAGASLCWKSRAPLQFHPSPHLRR